MSLNVERGTVVGPGRAAGRVVCEVPKLGKGTKFDCEVALPPTGPAADGHTHPRHLLPKGTRVIVAPIHGIPEDLVVIGVTL